jgi:hypothetical protein
MCALIQAAVERAANLERIRAGVVVAELWAGEGAQRPLQPERLE